MSNQFPLEVLQNPGHPYVYFTSLPPDILDKIANYFSRDLNSFTNTNTGTSSIDDAFSFLRNVISNERAKEEAFIKYLRDKTKDTIKLEIPNIDSNWADFVKEMQTIINFGDNGLRNLKNEYARLQKNQANFEKEAAKGKDKAQYEQDTLTKTSKQLQNIIKELSDKNYDKRHYSVTILESIMERYGASLFILNNGKLAFNRGELAAAIMSITEMVMSMYNMETYDLSPRNGEKRYITKENIFKVLDDTNMDEKVQTFLTSFKNIPSFREDIVTDYNLQYTDRGQKIKADHFVDRTGQLLTDGQELTKALKETLRTFTFPEKAIQLVKTVNALAEIDSALKFAVNGAFKVANTGIAGAKPDNIIGFLTVDMNALDILPKEKRSKIISVAEGLVSQMNDMVKSLSKENTTGYYQRQAENWNKMKPKMDALLKSLEDVLGYLPSCFVIEDSTKNYLSLYSRAEDGELSNAPHGGSLGASLEDQLNKIEALTTAGAISMIDKNWLTAAIINAGPGMIAEEQKNKIENYLAMFAAILLFDGQINIAQEAIQSISEQALNIGSTHQIHLFSVNNGYYPLSYVLKLTYDSLTNGLTRIESETRSNGVEVEIYGFVKKPSNNIYEGLKTWEETAEAAKNSTKIKMKFLVQFQNIIANLLDLK